MPESISYTDTFRHILLGSSPEKQLQIVKDIEIAMASGVEWCGNRIQFLRSSANPKVNQIVTMPPTYKEAVVKFGLVGAYQQSQLSALFIALWLDDCNCLLDLVHAIIQGQVDGVASPVWEHFLDMANLSQPIDIEKILGIVKNSSSPNGPDDKK